MEVSEDTGTSNGIESDTPDFEITFLIIAIATSLILIKRRNKRN